MLSFWFLSVIYRSYWKESVQSVVVSPSHKSSINDRGLCSSFWPTFPRSDNHNVSQILPLETFFHFKNQIRLERNNISRRQRNPKNSRCPPKRSVMNSSIHGNSTGKSTWIQKEITSKETIIRICDMQFSFCSTRADTF